MSALKRQPSFKEMINNLVLLREIHTTTSPDKQLSFVMGPIHIRQQLSYNDNLIKQVQMLLVYDPSESVRHGLALHGNKLDLEAVNRLLKDKSPDVRKTLAMTRETQNPETLKTLAQDSSIEVKLQVIDRFRYLDQNLAKELRSILDKDPDPQVKSTLEHMDTSVKFMADMPKTLKRIRRNGYKNVIMRVLRGE